MASNKPRDEQDKAVALFLALRKAYSLTKSPGKKWKLNFRQFRKIAEASTYIKVRE